MFLYENLFFFNIFCYFNPSHAYWNQRRLISGNLPGMFHFLVVKNHFFSCFNPKRSNVNKVITESYFPAMGRVYLDFAN